MKLWCLLALCLIGLSTCRAEDDIDDNPISSEDDPDFDSMDENMMGGGGGGGAPPPMPEAPEEPLTEAEASIEPVVFVTPPSPRNVHFADAFPDTKGIGKKWILSEAKKDGVDNDIAKYNGLWEIGRPDKVLLIGDNVLTLKTKARHAAISTKLDKVFNFNAGRPLIVQYDVKFQNGQECGGAYIKLLEQDPKMDLTQYNDKTPYSIMFGPDKCGMSTKIHTIFRFKNPKNGTTNEHHATQPDTSMDDYVTDKKSHHYRLVVDPEGHYAVSVDLKEIYSGDLAFGDQLKPTIYQPEEIADPSETKPSDWDEREKIPDPDASKPDDWDEDAPAEIPDELTEKPSDWLEEEDSLVPDPKAEKPADWDSEMDGEWEAPK